MCHRQAPLGNVDEPDSIRGWLLLMILGNCQKAQYQKGKLWFDITLFWSASPTSETNKCWSSVKNLKMILANWQPLNNIFLYFFLVEESIYLTSLVWESFENSCEQRSKFFEIKVTHMNVHFISMQISLYDKHIWPDGANFVWRSDLRSHCFPMGKVECQNAHAAKLSNYKVQYPHFLCIQSMRWAITYWETKNIKMGDWFQ